MDGGDEMKVDTFLICIFTGKRFFETADQRIILGVLSLGKIKR